MRLGSKSWPCICNSGFDKAVSPYSLYDTGDALGPVLPQGFADVPIFYAALRRKSHILT